jgi:hypothetical protein
MVKGDQSTTESRDDLPPPVLASPSEIPIDPDERINWWRPTWTDAARHVGYRWIFLAPVVLFLALFVCGFIFPPLRHMFFVVELKLFVFSGAVAVSLAGYVAHRAVKARAEPFCIHCGYNLSGLPDQYRCPECGRPYTWRLIQEYRRDPQWFIERWKMRKAMPHADEPFHAGPAAKNARRRSDGAS